MELIDVEEWLLSMFLYFGGIGGSAPGLFFLCYFQLSWYCDFTIFSRVQNSYKHFYTFSLTFLCV